LLRFSRELRLGKPVVTRFFYVYILQSEAESQRFYRSNERFADTA